MPNGHTQVHEDGHSGFTRNCVELLLSTILCISGISYDPQLEDVDIQFHASCVNIIMYAFVGDWQRWTKDFLIINTIRLTNYETKAFFVLCLRRKEKILT